MRGDASRQPGMQDVMQESGLHCAPTVSYCFSSYLLYKRVALIFNTIHMVRRVVVVERMVGGGWCGRVCVGGGGGATRLSPLRLSVASSVPPGCNLENKDLTEKYSLNESDYCLRLETMSTN